MLCALKLLTLKVQFPYKMYIIPTFVTFSWFYL